MTTRSAIESKRQDLLMVVERLLSPEECVRGVVAVGSVASGHAGPTSDIDAILFMDPVDLHIVPTESIWCPWDGSFHSIFVADQRVQRKGIQLDLEFLDLRVWSDDRFDWPEAYRAELAASWIAYDRDGTIAPLITSRTEYDDAIRLERLDKFVLILEGELGSGIPERNWERFSPFVCSARLNAAYDAIVAALFAYNRRWRFHPEREAHMMLKFEWLPNEFEIRMLKAGTMSSIDKTAFLRRVEQLRDLANQVLQKCISDGLYGSDPGGEAFMRRNNEPGRAWNMDAWNDEHAKRQRKAFPPSDTI